MTAEAPARHRHRRGGTAGGVVAGLLFVLPSLVILITLSWIYLAFGHLAVVAGIFYGVKPAVTAIVFQATHRIGARTLHQYMRT